MATPILVLVHGMGSHTENTLREEVETVLNEAYALYPSLEGTFASQVELLPVSYDTFFETYRQSLTRQNSPLHGALQALGGNATPIASAAVALNAIDLALSGDSFFHTHWLDVILYRYTMLAEPVRIHVAKAINGAVVRAGAGNVHILAHSLGTSVVHDALHTLYTHGAHRVGRPPIALNPRRSTLGSVHMVANVSHALQRTHKVGNSLVRPGRYGCTHHFAQYQHILDPIVRVEPFEPANDGRWVSHPEYLDKFYWDRPSEVTRANVHGLTHYLAIPSVHRHLFKLLFPPFKTLQAERNAADTTFFGGNAPDEAAALREITEVPPGAFDHPVLRLLQQAKALKDMVSGFKEVFR